MPPIKKTKPVTPPSEPEVTPDSADEQVENKFIALGFTAMKKPVGVAMPKMPVRLSDLSIQQLQDVQAEYAAWREYAEDLLRKANNTVIMLTEERDNLYNEKWVTMDVPGKDKATEKKAMVEHSQPVRNKQKELTAAEMYRDTLSAKVESFTNCLTVLSREITLRGGFPK